MIPELKLGRKVVAWGYNVDPVKGRYIKYGSHEQEHWILDDTGSIMPFQHAKLDPEGEPINGDMVEVSNNAVSYMPQYYRYIGQRNDGLHTVEQNGIESIFRHVRFPPPSKRDRVEDVLDAFRDSKLWKHEAFVEIDKIYKEES